jgi:hypothetical protein
MYNTFFIEHSIPANFLTQLFDELLHQKYKSTPLVPSNSGELDSITNRQWERGSAEQAYNAGLSAQVPALTIIRFKSRFRGKLK